MSFTPTVVIGLVTIGGLLSVYLLMRTRYIITKDSKPKPTGVTGDVRIVKRGDGAYILEQYGQMFSYDPYEDWLPVDIIDPQDHPNASDEDLLALINVKADALFEETRNKQQMYRMMNDFTVISHKKVSEEQK
jgi:hypothetical protein